MASFKAIVVIPTYNEAENIGFLLRTLRDVQPQIGIFIVDDNSPDGTQDIVRQHASTYPSIFLHVRKAKEGLGSAYREAFSHIRAFSPVFIVIMDADRSHDPREIAPMLLLADRYDCVVGSRYIEGGSIENWQWYRKLLSRYANVYVRRILQMSVQDCTSGFMCFRTALLDHIDIGALHAEGYAFLVEIKFRIVRAGRSLVEHPITFTERKEGKSKMSWRVVWEAVIMPWKIRFGAGDV